MKLAVLICCLALVAGCAGSERTALPPVAPRFCPGVLVDSAVALAALEGCTHVDGDLTIAAAGISDLGALRSLWSVEGTLGIHGCNRLESLDGLSRLHRVRHLAIVGNPALERLTGLSSLGTASGVAIVDNPRLGSLRGLEGLSHLEGLLLAQNGLTTLRGLENLLVAGDLVIVGNDKLIDVSPLDRLARLNHLTLERNPAIAASLGLFAGLERVSGSISISDNWGLSAGDVRALMARSRGESPRLYSRR
jgi:hypothetical protein